MVQDDAIMVRHVAMTAFVCSLAACGSLSLKPGDDGSKRVADDCPTLRRATAWINAMPTIGERSQRPLIVLVQVEGDGYWQLSPTQVDDASPQLQLELLSGGEGVPGSATYREADSNRTSVEIRCNENLYANISEITIAR